MYKKYFENKKAVIFDLEGTTVKGIDKYERLSYEQVLVELKLSYIDPNSYYVEDIPAKEMWEVLRNHYKELKEYNLDELVNKQREKFIKMLKEGNLVLTEGFWDILYELSIEKNFKTALTTNNSEDIAQIIINKLEIDNVFDLIVYGEKTRKGDPNPKLFLNTLKKLGISPKETIVFENSYYGVTASISAGIDTIVISNEERKWRDFEKKITDIAPDFSAYPGRLDDNFSDYMAKNILEAKDREQKILDTL